MKSGFQQDILTLYRHFLKLCKSKPEVRPTQPLRSSLSLQIKSEFRSKQHLPRWSLDEVTPRQLDYLYNQGQVKLAQLQRYDLKGFSLYVPKPKQ